MSNAVPGDPADSQLDPSPPDAPGPGTPGFNLGSGFSGTYEGGQLDNPFNYGAAGGADPLSVFQQYGSHPYSAVPAPSGSSSGGGGGPAAPDEVPDLRMVAAAAPPYLPETAVAAGSANGWQPQDPAFAGTTFDAGGFRDAHNTMISATAEVVALYKSLRNLVLSTGDWVFGQNAVIHVPPGKNTLGPSQNPKASTGEQTAPLDPAHDEPDPALFLSPTNNPVTFASGTPGSPGMNAAQENTLVAIAGGMELVGQFLGMMQSTGIAYASADSNSAAPPAETTGG